MDVLQEFEVGKLVHLGNFELVFKYIDGDNDDEHISNNGNTVENRNIGTSLN